MYTSYFMRAVNHEMANQIEAEHVFTYPSRWARFLSIPCSVCWSSGVSCKGSPFIKMLHRFRKKKNSNLDVRNS